MSSKGFYIPQDGHIVQMINVHDFAGHDTNGHIVSMENYNHLTIIVSMGVSPRAAAVITIESCSNLAAYDVAPTTATKIPFSYQAVIVSGIVAGNDVFGVRTAVAVADTGIIPVAGTPDNVMYVIDLDSSQLVSGDKGFRIDIVAPGAAMIASVIGILSGSRYASEQSASATV